MSPASTSGASLPLRDSPGASSTASDSPTPKNNIPDSHWHGLVSEERCQLLGTEEESSDRHSSGSDSDHEEQDSSWSPWTITSEQREYYCKQFRTLQPDVNGLLTGHDARRFFEKSRLSLPELKKIWQLADVTKDGALSLEEFKTAMHLVVLRRNNIDLPDKLPSSLVPSIPPLAPVPPPPPTKLASGEKPKPGSEESLSLTNVSPPQADVGSPQKGKDVSKWTKFMDSPTSSVSSPGPKPVNFDFHKSAVEQDPKILHPVPVRLTPESQNVTVGGDDGDPCRSPRRLTSDTIHDYESMIVPPDIRPIQRPQPKKPAGPGAIPPPPSQTSVLSCDGASMSNSTGFSMAGPASLPFQKKDPPPPPPPRPIRTHARSSSLDLNRLDGTSGKNIALLGAPPIVPPRVSPSTMTPKRLPGQNSEGGADSFLQSFADFTHFDPTPESDVFLPRRRGAFEVYRKPTPKNSAGVDAVDNVLRKKHNRPTPGERLSLQQLQEKNAALLRTCNQLSMELAEVQTEKAELEIQLEQLRASLPR